MPNQLEKISMGLQSMGPALGGLSAGLQGRLPEYQAYQEQQKAYQAQSQQAQQEMAEGRMRAMYQDANAMRSLAEQGNYDAVAKLGMERLMYLQQFGDADPEDTQVITQLAIAAKNGSEEAQEHLMSELNTAVDIGRARGFIQDPVRNTKVVGDYLVDDQTGEIVFNGEGKEKREHAVDANGVRRYLDDGSAVFPQVEKLEEELSEEDKFNRSKTLRSEIENANKDFNDIANSWDRIAASADEPSAAGDLALIFNFMKMLDPGSTVREGEFANAQNTAGVPGRIRAMYNRVSTGERLTQEQRSDFFGQAQNIYDDSKARADNIVEEYVRLGERYGLTRDDIVINRGEDPIIGDAANPDAVQEGTVIHNPATGEYQVMRGGQWVPM